MFVTVILTIGFLICGLDYGITLAIIAGLMNFLVPSFGALIAMIPALIIAALQGPWTLLWVAVIFFIQQHLESHLVSPLVLGNQLKIHPLTILILLLWAEKVFGFVGLVLVIPIYAAIKVVVQHVFKHYTDNNPNY
jgi:predicted PurR-regulated permease PerM